MALDKIQKEYIIQGYFEYQEDDTVDYVLELKPPFVPVLRFKNVHIERIETIEIK